MELRHLRTFLVAAETLNISAAARRLHVTQPALSRQIRELEQEIGHVLFLRHPGGLRLTAAGTALQAKGSKALAALDEAVDCVRGEAEQASAVLRVAYYGTLVIWAAVLAPALEKLMRKAPRVTYSVVERSNAEMLAGLRDGRIDVAVLGPGDCPAPPGVKVEVVCRFPAAVLAPVDHPLAKRRQIDLTELRGHEIISLTPEAAPGRDRSLIAACAAAGFTPKILPVGATLIEALTIGVKRQAVGIIGNFSVQTPYAGVTYIKLKPPGVMMDLHVGYAENSPLAAQLAANVSEAAQRAMERA